jgi:hypothetical protein
LLDFFFLITKFRVSLRFITYLHMLLEYENRKLLVAFWTFVLPSLALVLEMVLVILELNLVLALLTFKG